jgi:Na+/proline symporter
MTPVLVMLLALVAAYGLYIAARVARTSTAPGAFLDGGKTLPGWSTMFVMAAMMVAGMGLADYMMLIGQYGLQASHAGMGLLLAALAGLMIHKRLWIATRIARLGSAGDALGAYYQSVTLRIVMMALAVLFAVPFSASLLSQAGGMLADLTGNAIPRATGIWVMAFFLFLPAVTGGWRATVLIAAMQAVLLAVLILATTGFSELVLPAGFATSGVPVAQGILADRIPGVIQFSAGIGKDLPQGGLFTTVAILSCSLTFIGIILSPATLYLVVTTQPGNGFARGAVWLVSGVATGILLVVLPFLAARMTHGPADLASQIASVDVLVGAGFALVFFTAAQLAVSFFATSGAMLIVRELVLPYVLPSLGEERGARLTARIALAVTFFLVATMAAFAPLTAAILASLALPLSAQLLPALLGLAFVRWISRSAVLAGLIAGGLMVLFTEPPGLILVEGLFGTLPWGRWPLTVHSVAWGLALNVAAVLLVSIFTRQGAERDHRDRLHDEFGARWQTDFGSPAARSAKWSLTLIWAFFALGPGAILGNTFFSQPIFTTGDAALGVPSLWVWQILFWLIGVPLVWWIAYPSRLGLTSDEGLRSIAIKPAEQPIGRRRPPAWIAAGIARVTER